VTERERGEDGENKENRKEGERGRWKGMNAPCWLGKWSFVGIDNPKRKGKYALI